MVRAVLSVGRPRFVPPQYDNPGLAAVALLRNQTASGIRADATDFRGSCRIILSQVRARCCQQR